VEVCHDHWRLLRYGAIVHGLDVVAIVVVDAVDVRSLYDCDARLSRH